MKRYRLADLTADEIRKLCHRNPLQDETILETCRRVFQDVESRGDEAVRQYTAQFDKVELDRFEVDDDEWEAAGKAVDPEVHRALEQAASNISKFHVTQLTAPNEVAVQEGVVCWRESRPIDPVGLYIPGGNAVLPSSVLMLGIPATLAGCRSVVLAVPPRSDGSVAPEVLAAAAIAGIKRVFKIGGAQAIAAMTIGTETVPAVAKILGPGNRWVQTAKLLATFYGVAIDMVAGPSEVLVVADETADPALVASDLIAQAEHGADSQSVLVSPSERVIDKSLEAVERQLQDLPRRDYAQRALDASYAILTENLDEALTFSNSYAPEHLILNVAAPRELLAKVQSAGSVFLGPWSPEVAGDYASGTNHTLPTSGLARSFSGVSVDSFVKSITVQQLSFEGLARLRPALETLASVEGLEGHRRAVAVRFVSTATRSE
ncbi:MAG TPA: histidinol dehydrogenase [Acidobacteriota bacterium]|nr:histidinol dehydrogenase [Acidobacteriota bacterium]